MKKYIGFAVVAVMVACFVILPSALVLPLRAALPTPTEIIKTVASAATPEVLGVSSVSFKTVVFVGNKAARTNNTGVVWIQFKSANDSAAIPIQPGQVVSITSNSNLNPTYFYIDVVTAGDGVVAMFVQ